MASINEIYGRPIKSLGQNFLKNQDIAIAEAAHSYDKVVLEIGPGYGILTKELCKHAKRVIAVEKDANLYRFLKNEIKSKKLNLIHKDFFKASDEELDTDKIEIVIANIPYNLSSKVIEWLFANSKQAVLCLQKEFVEHMRAKCDTENYSRLSVMSELCFSMTKILDVSRGNFYPVPKVDSAVIYLKPRQVKISQSEKRLINLMMQHKNKTMRNALVDSHKYLNLKKPEIAEKISGIELITERAYKLQPQKILEVAKMASKLLKP
ncbi:MAG TPA: 16S rRNA (adenine(1518)-N(6)/adenine(1519)-N(6))-dimethyltransferase RsmA [Candidatus Aquilonibacter sp.]|nr:16S rRNA (adenine(1518)-N(6)/adenine(1519)-N(6))-dimethyltransferase RsmA [Candidatus Aquilonibacter sp.]